MKTKKAFLPPTKAKKERTTSGLCSLYISPHEKERGITMSANEMASKVRELKELKAMMEELTAEITSIEDEIKAELTARNADEISVDVYKIRWTKVVSNRLDTTAIKKELPEVAARFTKQVESRRFTIA